MARSVTTALNNELTAASLSPFLAVRLDIKDDPILTWTGLGTITIDSEQYIGTQNLINIQPAAESGALEANGVAITLSGIPVSLIAIALTEVYQGRSAKIFLGALDATGGSRFRSTLELRGCLLRKMRLLSRDAPDWVRSLRPCRSAR